MSVREAITDIPPVAQCAAEFAIGAFPIQLALNALADFVPFVLRDAGFDFHAQLILRRTRERTTLGDEVWHGAELPDGADGRDDVEGVASDTVLFRGDDRQTD